MDFFIPTPLAVMHRVLSAAGFHSYMVGGAVRDTLMGLHPHDYDVATDASPQDVVRLFRRTIPTGIKHGTVTVRLGGQSIETTTFRTEGKYTDGRHPDNWHAAATIEDDLSRRDFTMNAIAVDLGTGEMIDPFEGEGDILRHIIRAVGDPLARFGEDGLRPIRAIRFAAQTGFDIDPATYRAITHPDVIARAASVSVERFRDELVKILTAPRPAEALGMLEVTGLRALFIPVEVASPSARNDGGAAPNIIVRLAALFHNEGAEEAHRILVKLKFPNDTVKRVCRLIENCGFNYTPGWTDAQVRRFVAAVGQGNIEDLLALREACGAPRYNAADGRLDTPVASQHALGDRSVVMTEALRRRIQSTDLRFLTLSDLAVTGRDLIAAGVAPGPEVGRALAALLDAVIEEPAVNTRDGLMARVKAQ